jgi:hypothetical protein
MISKPESIFLLRRFRTFATFVAISFSAICHGVVVVHDDNDHARELAGDIAELVGAHTTSDIHSFDPSAHTHIITLGAAKFQQALNEGVEIPILSTYISQRSYSDLITGTWHPLTTAVFTNTNPADQIALSRYLLPDKNIGFIHSSQYGPPKDPQTFSGKGKLIAKALERSGIMRTVHKFCNDSDITTLILQRDSDVYPGNKLRSVLRLLHKRKKGAIGFSSGLTDAGALGSVYFSKEEILEKIQEVSKKMETTKNLIPSTYPDDVTIKINEKYARSVLKIDTLDERAIERVINEAR